MRNLLALLLFVPSLCLAQLPDYVPTGGLIGWYPLNDGQAWDFSGAGHHGIAVNVTLETDRFGNSNGAVGFQGQNCCGQPDPIAQHVVVDTSLFNLGDDYSIACWFKSSSIDKYQQCLFNSIPHTGVVVEYNNEHAQDVTSIGLGPGDAYWNILYQHGPFNSYNEEQWYHVTFIKQNNHFSLFVDGELDWEATYAFADGFDLEVGMRFGSIGNGHQILNGALDECGIWNRALAPEEIASLFLGIQQEYGCTDVEACNFQDEANTDDGSCQFGCLYCGEGTVWDSTLAQCISIAPPCAPSCGEGTVWDPVNEECIIAIPADLNYDGCVTVNDLLILLAVHGTCPPYPEWPDEPTDTTSTCGDPVTYWDYDYATVLIGDQCWFSENLRTTQYANGDLIPTGLTSSDWTSTSAGASAIYGEGSLSCNNNSPDIDACDEAQSLAEYGRLYNWYAVDDARGLCPAGWHVPTDEEWTELEDYITSQGFCGSEGTALKSTTGWYNNGNDNGTDDFGFSANPGGVRTYDPIFGGSSFSSTGVRGVWWSSSAATGLAWIRQLYFNDAVISRYEQYSQYGSSVRCIKD